MVSPHKEKSVIEHGKVCKLHVLANLQDGWSFHYTIVIKSEDVFFLRITRKDKHFAVTRNPKAIESRRVRISKLACDSEKFPSSAVARQAKDLALSGIRVDGVEVHIAVSTVTLALAEA